MPDPFKYHTFRAEWHVIEQPKITRNRLHHGPFPSKALAEACVRHIESAGRSSAKVEFRETPVSVAPIIKELIADIREGLSSLVHRKLIRKKHGRKAPVYLHENTVQAALNQYGEELQSSLHFEETPDG